MQCSTRHSEHFENGSVPASWTGWRRDCARNTLSEFVRAGRIEDDRMVDQAEKTDVVWTVADSDGPYGAKPAVGLNQQDHAIGLVVAAGDVEKASATSQSQAPPFYGPLQ